jgi:single-strand DNA-binding protein
VDCRAFGKTAETINKFFTKGKPIFIEGRLTFDSWTAQDGSKKSKLRVTVENFQFLPGTGGSGGGPGAGAEQPDQGSDEAGPPARGRPNEPIPDSEIPF